MHEVGLCEGIVYAALRRAAGRRPVRVRVRVGGHHAADREALEQAFQVLTMETELADATLEVVPVDGDELMLESLEFPPTTTTAVAVERA
ncbi:MAG: hydrogenase/urease maturation nickel metallochaperone HypA [Chloroflexota bacterium]|nr:hydrogenase/urease maturation nickel metallochaperone HypA [Chloroflexota bacterium]